MLSALITLIWLFLLFSSAIMYYIYENWQKDMYKVTKYLFLQINYSFDKKKEITKTIFSQHW